MKRLVEVKISKEKKNNSSTLINKILTYCKQDFFIWKKFEKRKQMLRNQFDFNWFCEERKRNKQKLYHDTKNYFLCFYKVELLRNNWVKLIKEKIRCLGLRYCLEMMLKLRLSILLNFCLNSWSILSIIAMKNELNLRIFFLYDFKIWSKKYPHNLKKGYLEENEWVNQIKLKMK